MINRDDTHNGAILEPQKSKSQQRREAAMAEASKICTDCGRRYKVKEGHECNTLTPR